MSVFDLRCQCHLYTPLQQMKYKSRQLIKGLSRWHRCTRFFSLTVGRNRSPRREPTCQTWCSQCNLRVDARGRIRAAVVRDQSINFWADRTGIRFVLTKNLRYNLLTSGMPDQQFWMKTLGLQLESLILYMPTIIYILFLKVVNITRDHTRRTSS